MDRLEFSALGIALNAQGTTAIVAAFCIVALVVLSGRLK